MSAFAPWQQRAYGQLAASLDEGRLGHALLLCGPAGIGKRAVAERLAQRVLCETPRGSEPCDACRACLMFRNRSQRDPLEQRPDGSLSHPHGHPLHPDAIFVGYAWRQTPSPARQLTQLVVEQVRELSERLSKTSQSGRGLVAIIDPADGMNEAAGNALLKTLEEPVPGRYLWLLSANPARLPATIRSRCQRIEFRLPPRAESLAWLASRGHDADAAVEALDAARGHPGLADAWLQNGGLALRRSVAADLDRLAQGKAGALEIAQAWVADDQADLRLGHAADLALARAAVLTDPPRTRRLATWFDAANRTRELLRSPVRADLAVTELLLAWRSSARATNEGGRA